MFTVAIYGSRRQQPEAVDRIDNLLREISGRGCRLVIHSKLYNSLLQAGCDVSGWNVYNVTDSDRFMADLAISIGGDGTFLRTAKWVGEKQIPIVGVNAGHLGYLTAFDISHASDLLEMLFSGNFCVENRTVVEVTGKDIPEGAGRYALNEIAILKHDTSSMINIEAVIDDNHLAVYRADGLIVATPTGSTGYSLSVGGPILQPSAPNLVISPIAAHSLTMRPLVINDTSVLRLTVGGRAESCFVSVDGNSFPVPRGAVLELKKAPYEVRVVMRADHSFAQTLREKLLWGTVGDRI